MRIPAAALCVLLACVGIVQPAAQSAPKARTTPEVWHPRLESFTPAGALQIEFGSALNASGYRKLRDALAWTTPSDRTDYYFDAYDGREFLLRTGGAPLKVRIKIKNGSPQWQVSRFVAKDRVQVGALGVYVHTTESWDGALEGPRVSDLLAATDDFAARLAAGGAPLRAAADAVETAWRQLRAEMPPPGLMVIDRTLKGHTYRFYPRKVTPAKTRLRAPLPGVDAHVTLMLGSEPEVDAAGRTVETFGLEAEAADPLTTAETRAIAVAIGRLMQHAGVAGRDQQEVPSESNTYTLRQLAR